MDCHLNFDMHIHEMYKKVMGHLLFLNRVKDKFESDTRKTVVESIALSVINYCLPVYGTTNATQLRRVQQLQNFAAKICAGGARRSDHATPFIDQLQWLKIDKKKVCFDVAIHVYKVKMKMFPERYMHLPTHSQVYTRTTRHDTKTNYTYTRSQRFTTHLLVTFSPMPMSREVSREWGTISLTTSP